MFCVSTDFLLGVTNIPDRKNYDIEELGLSVAAAKNLYTGKVNPRMVNLLLENNRFAYLTTLLARYLDEDLSAGIAAQNQLFNSVSSLLTGYARTGPEDRQAALETAQTVRSAKQPPTIADTNALQSVFLQVVHELERDSTASRQEAQALTKDVAEEVFSNLQEGVPHPFGNPAPRDCSPLWNPRQKRRCLLWTPPPKGTLSPLETPANRLSFV